VREDSSPLHLEDRPYAVAVRTRQAQRRIILGLGRPDGERRWLQVHAVPLFAPDGGLTRVVLSYIDITEQKRANEALRQRDAILEAVAFAAERLLTADDWEHSIGDVLHQLGTATGASRVSIVSDSQTGTSDSSRYEWTTEGVAPRPQLPSNRAYLESVGLGRWQPVLRGGGIIRGRLREFPDDEQAILAAQGVCSTVVVPIVAGATWWGFISFDDCFEERQWPAGTVDALKTAAGTLGAAIVRRRAEAERLQLVREQSARAEAEAAQRRLAFLAEASQILAGSLDYETTLQSVADLVVPGLADCCFVDLRELLDGSIRRVASAAIEPFARDVADPPGTAIDPTTDHPVARVMRTGQPILAPPMVEQFRQSGGGAFASALSVPLVTRTGTAGAMTWLGSAARPSFTTQDLRLAQDLARRGALAMDNARLYREARVAVSIRDEFLSVAAHELKTPMTSLRGYAQLLGREFERGEAANPERARRAATTIQVQSDKLARLVAQLLDISRIQSGKLAIERKSADFSHLVKDMIEAARPQLKNHTLMARLPGKLPLFIDPLRIEQVVTNLIDNAIKYSPEGGQIDVTLTDHADVVQFTVRDRGVGVPHEHRAHIFDRFYQAHAGGPLTSMAGMGLGLYISRQIVELHGGTIDAEFPDDGGTKVVVTLPRE
jgi:signal transduction histidine kinase